MNFLDYCSELLSQVLLIFGVLLPATKQKEMAFVRFLQKHVKKSQKYLFD